jgi:trans-aconitate 2-methyltransferase
VRDLLNAVPTETVRTAIDIGCGPGNSTALLAARFPQASIRGLDSSADMLAAARQRLPQLRFDLQDIASWDEPGPFDLILGNAVLQWVPRHELLLPALVRKLAAGGALALQMPDNLAEPAHRLMRAVAAEGPWAARLKDSGRTQSYVARHYYELLAPHCSRVDVWRTVYHHALAGGAQAVVEWFRGSGLRTFLAPLDAAEQTRFLEEYGARIARAYAALADGTVLLPFPRFFVVATR